MPLFSVIMPVFNAEKTVAEAVHSILTQSFTNWELVVTNDGSTDSSLDILAAETEKLENVSLLDQENQGLGAARNAAVQKSSGKWLVFLDADDYWASNKLAELQIAIHSNAAAEVIYHPIMELMPNGLMRKRRFWTVHSNKELLQKGNPLVPSAVAIKRDVFLKHGGFIKDRDQVEDLMLWFRLFDAGTTFGVIHKPLTVYRIGSGVTSNLEDHLIKVFRAVDEAVDAGIIPASVLSAFKQRKYYEAARQLHKMGAFKDALNYYNLSEAKDAKYHLFQAFCRLGIRL